MQLIHMLLDELLLRNQLLLLQKCLQQSVLVVALKLRILRYHKLILCLIVIDNMIVIIVGLLLKEVKGWLLIC